APNSVPTAKPPTTPAATSPLPATAARGVHVRQRLPVINRPTRSFRMLALREHHYFRWIKAKLITAGLRRAGPWRAQKSPRRLLESCGRIGAHGLGLTVEIPQSSSLPRTDAALSFVGFHYLPRNTNALAKCSRPH